MLRGMTPPLPTGLGSIVWYSGPYAPDMGGVRSCRLDPLVFTTQALLGLLVKTIFVPSRIVRKLFEEIS
ncbi:hypothetical protein KEJ39_06190 [Candidatus Bathyarchaeota archaeon]|nr:hypothetical protein [Candidatus Bathyarchaeota archaeon]